MSKKIKTTDTDITVQKSTAMIVTVGLFKFVKDSVYPWVEISIIGDEKDEFISEETVTIKDHADLQVFAINWVFENVEIVKEIKEEK